MLGENFVCCVPLEDQAATTNNLGLGSPFAGNLEVYPVYRIAGQVGAEESPKPQTSSFKLAATIIRGVLVLQEAKGEKREARSELRDIAGRKVLDLHSGPNDVRALAPGVYFVREAQAQAQAQAVGCQKVVLTE